MFLFGAWKNSEPSEEQVQEAIEHCLTSLSTAYLIEDRRAALSRLQYVAKEYPKMVGVLGITGILRAFAKDKEDETTTSLICQLLRAIIAEPDDGSTGNGLGEMVIKDKSMFFDPVLYCLQFHEQYELLELLLLLTENERVLVKTQEDILSTRDSVKIFSRCIDVEKCRLRALQLLTRLSTCQPDIQKLVMFGGSAERALEIVLDEEGGIVMGGAVVKACLDFVACLVEDSHLNQEYLVEQPAFKRALSFLITTDETIEFGGKRYAENVNAAWRMFASLLSSDSKRFSEMQSKTAPFLQLKAIEHSLADGEHEHCQEAAVFLSRLLTNNNQLRLQFLKTTLSWGKDSHCSATYLLVKKALSKGLHSQAIYLFGCLLNERVRFSDGQLAIAATLAPGAESPGLLIVDCLKDFDVHNDRSMNNVAAALQLTTFLVYENEQVKMMLARHRIDDEGSVSLLLEHIITHLLIISHKLSSELMISGLALLIVWCDESPEMQSWILKDLGGIVQSLMERVILGATVHQCRRPEDCAIAGLSAFLLATLMQQSSDLTSVLRSRLGPDLLASRLEALSESPVLLNRSLIVHPLVSIFRSKYPLHLRAISSGALSPKPDPRDEEIRYLKMQLQDADGSQYRTLVEQLAALQENNAALLAQVMHAEEERQELLSQIGALEQQQTAAQPSNLILDQQAVLRNSKNMLRNLRAVLMPEFEEKTAPDNGPSLTEQQKSVANI